MEEEDFVFIGRGEAAVLYYRHQLRGQTALRVRNRSRARHLTNMSRFVTRLKNTTYTYTTEQCYEQYNGAGSKGTGGPKSEWLREAFDEYIINNHPELRETMVMRKFREMGWEIIFTVPYWAKSQPIELAWAYVKGYVARNYHPGRRHKELRQHILKGMYGGPNRHSPKPHTGMDSDLAQSFINHTHKHINMFIQKTHNEHNMTGVLGDLVYS